MKNILQGMRGGSYLIGAGLDREDPQAIRRGWQIVEKNQERISHLVLDMLSYSKDREPDRVEGDLNATIDDIVELMQLRAQEQQCRIEFTPGDTLPAACFDPEAMHRAILNLVTNALDALAEQDDGVIQIRSGFDPQTGWWIDVIDNGPGIPADQREQCFSLFESRKGNRGTGLGLPVSRKIVAEHGGTLQLLDSETPGCTFRLTLPPQTPENAPLAGRDTLA
jgi:signal transduction histidine kinase